MPLDLFLIIHPGFYVYVLVVIRSRNMREINTDLNHLVCAGEDLSDHWPLKSRAVVKMLEKKEVYCSWFQLNGGTVEDQVPALRVSNKYYTMPLRIQKSIFRHMRLHAAFVNRERTATGVEKLRIPITLLREKMRTARRFMVYTHPRRIPHRVYTCRI